jgi:probable F420-dependent oxidoreductase
MRFGATTFLTDRSMRPDDIAHELEARGYTSLYIAEHTHIPSGRQTPAPMGEPLPDMYARTLDPFVALTAAALATSTLVVGTGICLVAQHDTIVLAKQVSSLDFLSGGRFSFGIGFGWNVEEMGHHGVSRTERRAIVREKLLAMKELWTNDVASYSGSHVRFEPSWQWPKPAQKPHPPVLIGGAAGPILFSHIAEYADGWIPIGGRGIKQALPDLRLALEDAGRDPDRIEIVPMGTIPETGKLEYLSSLPIRETVLTLPSAERDEVLRTLDDYENIIAPFRE